jgi:hypothetical protein
MQGAQRQKRRNDLAMLGLSFVVDTLTTAGWRGAHPRFNPANIMESAMDD